MATVTACSKVKEWNGKPIYGVTLSDGNQGESFNEIPIGTNDTEIEITENQYGKKFKYKKPNSFGGGGAKQNKGNESFAMSYAKDLVIADKVNIKDLLPTADKIFDWMEGKKK